MKLAVIHPPIAGPKRPINWDAWRACGTIVPPPTQPPRRWGGVLFVAGLVVLVGGPMLLQVLS